jgi:cell division transport system permease protein
MLNFIKRIIKYGWKIFIRDWQIALTNVFILVMVILLISFLFLSREIGQILISFLKEKADISVYFKEEVPEEEILKFKEEILKIPEVKEVKYVSREEALKEFKERHKENPILMEALSEIGANPFLASLSIRAGEASHYEAIINFLNEKNSQFIEKVDYYQRKPLIERIFSLISNFERGGILLSAISILIAILVTFNTIRLAIINFGEEISIQRLVGASNWFIRGPFLVQGIFAGIFSALLSLLIVFLSCYFLSPKISILFKGLNLFEIFSSNLGTLILIQFFAGILLGTIPSLIAIRKFLKI